MSNGRLIIFDLDGTLVNAYPAVSSSVNDTLKKLGFPRRTHQEIKRSVGGGDRHLMSMFVGEDLADQAIRLYRPHHKRALVADGGVKFLAGAKGILTTLKTQGYRIAIATNRPECFTTLILKKLEIQKIFDMVLCADRSPRPKPYPDMLLMILKRLNIPKSQTIYVGDMGIDVLTGQRAGVLTVAVTTGSNTAQELKILKPWRIINRIGQLKTILKENYHE